ncbi:unnamed protein product [Rotaria sordida]|uniref:Piwi domain-containing protein n=1 Tax=Rotaria sordida TaxID=392033 RepID=A0A815R9R2_9BILA|nr:unnamed protein product [Rotaria sordida]CAF1473878.1 unnamed protein product [Rotaria sordida]CAF3978721.1 unnamed protein product [Rotaria sordida]CAF4016059.1 unnamed protein product [Rotaria sordida]
MSSTMPKGRGRARSTQQMEPTPPTLTSSHDVSIIVTTTSNSNENYGTEASSASSKLRPSASGRGRDQLSKQTPAVAEESRWVVSTLTIEDFKSNSRPSKPNDQCTLGEEIRVIVNFFPVVQYPQKGFPSLPVLYMHNKAFVPMEFVDIEPVRIKKITDEERALLCQKSSLKPCERRQAIQDIRHNPKQQCFEEDPFVKAWNLNVDVKMMIIPARILSMPTIVYNNTFRVTAERIQQPGVWVSAKTRFYEPKNFPAGWAMINLSSQLNENMCIDFYEEMNYISNSRGINCPPPEIYEIDIAQQTSDNIISILGQMMTKNRQCQFLLVILPDDKQKRKEIYGDLKKACELEPGFGVPTQMIKPNNAVIGTRRNANIWDHAKVDNILLKINAKLNGTNHKLEVHEVIRRFFSCGHHIMYVGADLSHASPGSGNLRSAVAVVASADDIPNRYFKEVYVQERVRNESVQYIVDMKDIMKSLIRQYDQHRSFPPSAIVIYRDGISVPEFNSVFEKELTDIRTACVELSPAYRPSLTYIVVNKRHKTRFFPEHSTNNVVAGTVVDSPEITSATTYNFYLNSHHSPLVSK